MDLAEAVILYTAVACCTDVQNNIIGHPFIFYLLRALVTSKAQQVRSVLIGNLHCCSSTIL